MWIGTTDEVWLVPINVPISVLIPDPTWLLDGCWRVQHLCVLWSQCKTYFLPFLFFLIIAISRFTFIAISLDMYLLQTWWVLICVNAFLFHIGVQSSCNFILIITITIITSRNSYWLNRSHGLYHLSHLTANQDWLML